MQEKGSFFKVFETFGKKNGVKGRVFETKSLFISVLPNLQFGRIEYQHLQCEINV